MSACLIWIGKSAFTWLLLERHTQFFFTNNNNNTWHVVCRSLHIQYHGCLSWVCHSSSFAFIHLHVTSSWLTAELCNGWGSLFFLHESYREKKKYNDANKYVLVCGLLAFVPATVPLKGLFYGACCSGNWCELR